ncbi:DUF2635 domain-containing protein [Pseudogulbenkiania sp. MAI-1]|uniref:DUF2635 domain-containing protein n=1 Tax=Pseudogulbenkiania sp. MAI-1 TaxID=990370 RepID=UPI00045E5C80|nr:DUF2635 domain-containing protein [Pseudogulbenkiania sp. MAI-1]
MNEELIKPAPGLSVRLEDGSGFLPAAGKLLPLTSYWRRRIGDGDAELGTDQERDAAIAQRLADTEAPAPAGATKKAKE